MTRRRRKSGAAKRRREERAARDAERQERERLAAVAEARTADAEAARLLGKRDNIALLAHEALRFVVEVFVGAPIPRQAQPSRPALPAPTTWEGQVVSVEVVKKTRKELPGRRP